MPECIVINEGILKRIKFINLLNESEDIKWKILELHNKSELLGKIDGVMYTIDGHRKFLDNLHNSKEQHYVVYFDNRPVAKYNFTIESNIVTDIGNYMFAIEDRLSGLGLLIDYFLSFYLFECLDIEKVCFRVLKTNRKQVSYSKKTGGKIIFEDERMFYFEKQKSTFQNTKTKMEEILNLMFNNK